MRSTARLYACSLAMLALGWVVIDGVPAAEAKAFTFRSSLTAKTILGSRSSNKGMTNAVIHEVTLPNELCQEAFVSQFEVQEGILKIPVNADYCELSAGALPAEVISLLARIRDINTRYAAAVGRDPEILFGLGVRISLAEHPLGPLGSFADRYSGILEIDVFKDFKSARFPDRVYAHELTHWLLFENHFGDSELSIEGDYLFHESFSDLVSSYVTGSLVMDFKDPSIRSALTFPRNGKPVQSMNRPFRDFFLGTYQIEPLKICAAIPAKSLTANERAMCKFLKTDHDQVAERNKLYAGALEKAPTAKELTAAFRPEHCLVHYKNGTAGLNACFMSSLGPVLMSFIHSIESTLGPKPLVTVLAAIDTVGTTPDHYDCAFSDAEATGRWGAVEPVSVSFLSLMRVFQVMREGLSATDRLAFDASWAAHGLDTWAKLDHYDRDTVVAAFAYRRLVEENSAFATEFNCGSDIPSRRGKHCAAKCAYEPAAN